MTQVLIDKTDYKNYFEKAISYSRYQKNFQKELEEGSSPLAQYLPQNWRRQSRLDRKFKLREDLLSAIENLDTPINWLLISEHWCGDASQIVPVINKVAEASQGKINLSIVYRDENDALMNAHLTDGRSRSIPILIQLNRDFNLINAYGPRPDEAQKLVKSLLANEEAYDIPVHSWYAKDKQQTIQDDLVRLIKNVD